MQNHFLTLEILINSCFRNFSILCNFVYIGFIITITPEKFLGRIFNTFLNLIWFHCYMISVSNCFKNRISFSENKRRSFISYLRLVIRSIPIPKANPLYFLLSIPQFSNTFGSTIPHPKISTHPLPLHMVQPSPLQIEQEISISAEGSVNGK